MLLCPHGKEIEMIKKFGITMYVHKGGDNCSLLNTYRTNLDKIIDHMFKSTEFSLLLDERRLEVLLNDAERSKAFMQYAAKRLSMLTYMDMYKFLVYMWCNNKTMFILRSLRHHLGYGLRELLKEFDVNVMGRTQYSMDVHWLGEVIPNDIIKKIENNLIQINKEINGRYGIYHDHISYRSMDSDAIIADLRKQLVSRDVKELGEKYA